MRDILSNIQMTVGAPQTLSGVTPNNSAAVDLQGWGALSVYLKTNTVTDAGDATGFSIKLQHSDALVGSGFVDVPAAEIKGTIAAVTLDTADDIIAPGGLSYLGVKRYVRAVVTGSTLTNAVVTPLFVRGKPAQAPVTPVGATVATT